MFLSPASDSPDLSQWKRIDSLTDAVINSINFFCVSCVCVGGGGAPETYQIIAVWEGTCPQLAHVRAHVLSHRLSHTTISIANVEGT